MSKFSTRLIAVFAIGAALHGGLADAQVLRIASRWAEPGAKQEPLPLALGGFCPVKLRDRKQWQLGDASLALAFDGLEYRFATLRELEVFAAAPEAYAPVLNGDCPVTLVETGQRTPGVIGFAVVHRERLSFFASDELRQKFLEDPRDYDEVDVALGGHCPVSRRERQLEVPGIPKTAAIHHGLRFFFASAHERSMFLANPAMYDGSNGQDANPLELPVKATSPGATDRKLTASRRSSRPGGGKRSAFGNEEDDVVLGALPAMTGYCPVTLKQQGLWVRGRYESRVDLGGIVFLTAGAREKDALTNDPLKYIPVLGGDCPVTFRNRKERIRGSVFHAAEYEGRLYLLADADRKATFKANPAPYLNIDLAEGGVCVVTRIDERRDVPGLDDQSTWHHGFIYRFAGPEQKKKFLADPKKYEAQ